MSKNKNLVEVGEIFHSTMGTDETWATLYFDTDTGEFAVIESSDTPATRRADLGRTSA
jgi:hypothetical protein